MNNKVAVLFIAKNNGISINETIESSILTIKEWNHTCDIDFYGYINDCDDNTEEQIRKVFIDKDETVKLTLINSEEKTTSFPPVVKKERIISIAKCRNKCLDIFLERAKLDDYSAIIWIDSDYIFDRDLATNLIPKVISKEVDAISGYSMHADITELWDKKDLYDKWATRESEFEHWWACKPYEDLPDIVKVSCTFNGFCVFNPKFFNEANVFSEHGMIGAMGHIGFDTEWASIFVRGKKMGLRKVFMDKTVFAFWFKSPSNVGKFWKVYDENKN